MSLIADRFRLALSAVLSARDGRSATGPGPYREEKDKEGIDIHRLREVRDAGKLFCGCDTDRYQAACASGRREKPQSAIAISGLKEDLVSGAH